RLHRMATRDPLTGLPNRTQLHERLRASLQEAAVHGQAVGVLYLDLDRFKLANDSLGHRVGDRLLQMAADRIRACLRASDLAARIGGDEFVILLPGIESRESTEKVACKLMQQFREPFVLHEQDGIAGEFFFTVSIGICLAPQDGLDAGQLLSQADAAMYQVKEKGGNGYNFYTPNLIRRYERRLSLRNALHRALEERQFVLHYQPQVDLHSGRILGVEALLRWKHPDQGLVPPMEFIPALEESGLILEVGKWVLETACRTLRDWEDAHLPPTLHVAINLSGRQMQHPGLAQEILDALHRHRVPPRRLHVELTETLLMEHVEAGRNILHSLSEAGITIELDDFGTGYSSLALLRRLPVDVLKIDRSFLEGVPGDGGNETIVRTIVEMAHTLRMRALAEGVETLEQCRYLAGLGCDAVQGYLISPPRPAGELLPLLREEYPLPECRITAQGGHRAREG
ncbi:MAG: EAL domain-containing protein, partial [Gammaproteobacteria bacterium]